MLELAPDAKRGLISAHHQAANAFSCNDFFSNMQRKKVKFHQDNTTIKDKFTT